MKKMLFVILGTLLLFPLMGMNRSFNRMSNHADYVLLNELRNAGYVILPEVVVVAYRNEQDTIRPPKRETLMERKHYHGQMVNDTIRHKGVPQREKERANFQKQGKTMHGRLPMYLKRPMVHPRGERK